MGPPDSEEVKLDFAVPTYQGTSPTESGFVEPGAPGSVGRRSAIELPGPCLSFYPRALPSDLSSFILKAQSDAFGHVSELHMEGLSSRKRRTLVGLSKTMCVCHCFYSFASG